MTDDLIFDLSRDPPRQRRVSPGAIVLGAALLSLAAASLLSFLWLKPRSDFAFPLIVDNPIFLLKFVFLLGVTIPAIWVVRDLSVPGKNIGVSGMLIVIPFIFIIAPASHELVNWHAGALSAHDNQTLLDCLWQIPALAMPALVILVSAVRLLGPTDLRRTGAYVGLLAGSIGAVAYALHCNHDSLLFVGVAYTAAIVETALLGVLFGPRLLRWS